MAGKFQNAIIINVLAGVLIGSLCLKFSAAQFTYSVISFIAICVMLFCKQKKRIYWPHNPYVNKVIVGIGIFYSFLFIASLISKDFRNVQWAAAYSGYALPFFMCWWVREQVEVDEGVKWGILVGSCVNFGIGIYEMWSWPEGMRVMSLFLYPNKFGVFIVLIMPVLIYFWNKEKNYIIKILMGFVCFGGILCLYGTESRSATIGLFAGCALAGILFALQSREILRKKLIKTICVSVVLCLVLGGGITFNVIQERQGVSKWGGERALMLEASYEMWNDHKFAGVGLAHWEENYYSDKYHPEKGEELELGYSHNMIAQFFSTTGILGGIGYLLFLVITFTSIFQIMKWTYNKTAAVCLMAIFCGFTIQGLAEQTIIYNTGARIYFALIGYLFAICHDGFKENIP